MFRDSSCEVVLPSALPLRELLLAARRGSNAKRILVVEDNADTRELLGHYLRGAGYTVAVAEDGIVGFATIEAQSPDLVITDLRMPNSDGVELIQKLRGEPELAELPILVLTANGDGGSHRARSPM